MSETSSNSTPKKTPQESQSQGDADCSKSWAVILQNVAKVVINIVIKIVY